MCEPKPPPAPALVPEYENTELLQLRVDRDLYRAFQRCVWILIHETGRSQIDIANQLIHEFLVRHDC